MPSATEWECCANAWRLAVAYATASAVQVTQERIVRVFRNGRNQAIRIPKEFELSTDVAIIRKEGDRLVIESAPRRTFHELLGEWAAMEPIEEDFGPIDDPPPEPFEL
jgi:antitoxin VapB